MFYVMKTPPDPSVIDGFGGMLVEVLVTERLTDPHIYLTYYE